jgi:pimeloyl-ACP methyl ester carboxylesterase
VLRIRGEGPDRGTGAGSYAKFPVATFDLATARENLLDRYLEEAGAALDILRAERPGMAVVLHGTGMGALVATALALIRPEVGALVLEQPTRRVSRVERLLLLRERFRKGSDMPSSIMREAGTDKVGNWLAMGALQQALLRSSGSPARADLPIATIGKAAESRWLADFLRRRGVNGIEAVETAADGEIDAWLERVLA